MGKSWDSFVPGPSVWREVLRVLKPGGHLIAFAGDRTEDLMGISLRIAKFERRGTVHWCYFSGFPKSLDVSKAIDRLSPRLGRFAKFAEHYERRRLAIGLTHAAVCDQVGAYGEHNHGGASVNWAHGYGVPSPEHWAILAPLLSLDREQFQPLIDRAEAEREQTGIHASGLRTGVAGLSCCGAPTPRFDEPATPDAIRWEGWGTATKPAIEPAVWARKPLNPVPVSVTLQHITCIVEVLLWSIAPARFVALCSESSRREYGEDGRVSVRWLAAVLSTLTSADPSEVMDTFKSREAAGAFSNIARSWSAILVATSNEPNRFTTETATALTTGLRTLNSLTSGTTQASIIADAIRSGGVWFPAGTAVSSSASAPSSTKATPTGDTAHELAILQTVALSVFAAIAESSTLPLQVHAGTSAGLPAITLRGTLADSIEPALLCRRPLRESSIARQVLATGTGALHIDACRFGYGDPAWVGPQSEEWAIHHGTNGAEGHTMGRRAEYVPGSARTERNPNGGRWPANLYACAKASRAERERGCDGLPAHLAAGLTKGGYGADVLRCPEHGGTIPSGANASTYTCGCPRLYGACPPTPGHEAVDRKEGSAGVENPRAGAGRTASTVRNFHPT